MITADMIEELRAMAAQLKDLKVREMALRREIAAELGDGLDPGTHTITRDGFKIKLKLGLSYGIDQDELKFLIDENMLTDEEMDLLRIKYDLRLADYKKADINTDTLDDVIIVKPAAPTLDITLGE